jgi:predicted MFS family arabinose efflux permease
MMTYAPIFLSDPSGIGLSESSISLFPFIFSISIVLVALTVIPYLGREKIEKYLTFGSGFVLFGLIICVLAPQKGIAFIGFSYFLLALGNAFFRPMSDTYGANVLQDRERAKVTTIFVFFYTAFSAIAVPLAGLLYKYFPQLPFIALVPIQLVIILLTLRLSPKT